jgi:aerobic carbon-monoxide dehydrogenase large subunit
MKISPDQPSGLSALDRPNSYIGRSVPRPNLARLTQGRGQYVSDVVLPRMAHVAYLRSPHAHARIRSIGTQAARQAAGVVAVVTGAELAKVITPWVGAIPTRRPTKNLAENPVSAMFLDDGERRRTRVVA